MNRFPESCFSNSARHVGKGTTKEVPTCHRCKTSCWKLDLQQLVTVLEGSFDCILGLLHGDDIVLGKGLQLQSQRNLGPALTVHAGHLLSPYGSCYNDE